ncbi:hypothetical protein FRC09_017654, partial [Ceratobasidium sp. 395]
SILKKVQRRLGQLNLALGKVPLTYPTSSDAPHIDKYLDIYLLLNTSNHYSDDKELGNGVMEMADGGGATVWSEAEGAGASGLESIGKMREQVFQPSNCIGFTRYASDR